MAESTETSAVPLPNQKVEAKKDPTPTKPQLQQQQVSTTTTATSAASGGGRSSSRRGGPTKSSTAAESHRQLSKIQSQQVDVAFEEIFGYKWGTVFSWQQLSQSTESLTSEQIMLGKVLGKKRAAQLLQLHPTIGRSGNTHTPSTYNNRDREVTRKHQTYKYKTDTSVSHINKTAPSKKAASASATNAGVAAIPPVAAGGGARNMDQLLQEMSQSNKVTTTAKTAADWESFKEKAGPGLGEKLEEHVESKGAYLKRQDFLTRVDQRQFEKEKAEREQTRAARDR
jgi:hypothetical protein